MHQRALVPTNTRPRIPSHMGLIVDPQLHRTRRGLSSPADYWEPDLHHLANAQPNLGQWAEIIGAAAGAFTGGSAPSGGPSQGGATTGMQQPGSTATAVSPTFQTAISPQISPVFSQMQDSAGATQAATTTQYQPGGMSAEGGGAFAPPMPGGMPAYPREPSPSYFSGPVKGGGLPYTPLDPATLTNLPNAGGLIRDIRESQPFNWTPVYVLGGVALAGVLLFAWLGKRKGAR